MNRRSLLRGAVAAGVGALAALLGIRPKAKALEFDGGADFLDFRPPSPDSFALIPYKIALYNPGDEPLRLWFNGRFCVDLPPERYTDTVTIDWVFAKEDEDRYVANCRVRPSDDAPWEVLPMKRVRGKS